MIIANKFFCDMDRWDVAAPTDFKEISFASLIFKKKPLHFQ